MNGLLGYRCALLVGLCLIPAESFAETTENKAVEAFFNSKDPFIQNTVIPNIEKNRKSDFTLRFVDSKGKVLPNLKITGSLQRHQFLFGICPPESRTDFDPRWVAAWSNISNYGVAQNAMKWSNVEKEMGVRDFSRIDRMLDISTKNDVVLEYHFLTGYHPQWLAALPDAEKAQHQKDQARESLKRYKDKMAFFQVYNEDWQTHIARAKLYFDQTEFFVDLVKEFPGVKFGVSDCWTLNNTAPLPDPNEVKRRYPGISYIAAHCHKPRGLWVNPKEMYNNLDKYINSGVKIHLTEFGIQTGDIEGGYVLGEWNDEKLAEYFVQVRAVAFSHPAVEAFNQWGMGPEQNRWTGNTLLNDDYSPTPAYAALESLIKHKLNTSIDGLSDVQGQYGFRGFHGRYEITAANQAGQKATVVFTADRENTKREFVVENAEGLNFGIKVGK